jgi:uncharacterized protein (UPF0335 family)
MTTIWERKKEALEPAEAAVKLLGYVREIKRLDEENTAINRAKASTFKQAKSFGLSTQAIKELCRPDHPQMVDTPTKMLRHYLVLTCGSEAAATMKDENDFGKILFGDAESWPSKYAE